MVNGDANFTMATAAKYLMSCFIVWTIYGGQILDVNKATSSKFDALFIFLH